MFGLRGRLVLLSSFGTGVAVVAGLAILFFTGLSSVQETLGQTYCQIANRVVDQFENDFERESSRISNIATDVLTTEVLLEVDKVYRNRDASWISSRQKTRTREWAESKSDSDRSRFLHSSLSRRLGILTDLNDEATIRISVFDRYGLLAACPSSYKLEQLAA